MSAPVEVLGPDGKRLTYTTKNGLVRILLKSKRATIARIKPFTIKMKNIDDRVSW